MGSTRSGPLVGYLLLHWLAVVLANIPMDIPSLEHRIYQICDVNTICPAMSSCRPSGCDGYTCLCHHGFVASDDRTLCLKAAKIGEDCHHGKSRCISSFATCLGTCQCLDIFVPTKDGRCKRPDANFVGETCGKCEFPSKCVDGVCRCADQFRPLTTEEFWLDPLSTLQCRPRSYSLTTCNGSSILDQNANMEGQPGVTDEHVTPNDTINVKQEVSIFGTCTNNAQCPQNSECRPSSCDGFICLCKDSFIASDNRSYCLRAKKVGDKCSPKTDRCLSPFAMCNTSGVCECMDMFYPTQDGSCKLPGNNHVGEACSNSKQCEFPAVCTSGSCQCRHPYRETTQEEFWLDPMLAIQCRPEDFSIWKCNGSDIIIPLELRPPEKKTQAHDHESHGGHEHDKVLPDEHDRSVTSHDSSDHDSLLIPLNIAGLLAVAAFALIIAVIFKTKRRRGLKKHNMGSTDHSSIHSSIHEDQAYTNALKIPRPNVSISGSLGSESWTSFSSVGSANHRYSPYLQSLGEWQRTSQLSEGGGPRISSVSGNWPRGHPNDDFAIYANQPM